MTLFQICQNTIFSDQYYTGEKRTSGNFLALSEGNVIFYRLDANVKHRTKKIKETINNHEKFLGWQSLSVKLASYFTMVQIRKRQ